MTADTNNIPNFIQNTKPDIMDPAAITLDICAYKEPMDIKFRNLTYSIKKKREETKILLHNVSGTFLSGRLTAVLGPSGAGKSSLLNVLSGFKTSGVSGNILINDVPRNKHDFRRKSSYITQDFAMMDKLTVLETLDFAADLKLSRKVSKSVKQKIINDIVELLNLKKCLHTYIEKISGGERKRLSIGVELVTNPPVMFFDEPTSGLDSFSSLQVITHLRELARSGRTIICVIHSPSSRLLELFDDLYILSNGSCIYNGTLNNMVDTFQEAGFSCPKYYNRADFALEIASLDRERNLDLLLEKFSSKKGLQPTIDDKNLNEETRMLSDSTESPISSLDDGACKLSKKRYPITQWRQFLILIKRSLLCSVRDFHYAQMRVVCHILVAFMLGAVFYDIGNEASKITSNASCLFFFLMFIFFANSVPAVLTFPTETSVFIREHLNNWYSLSAYITSKLVSDLPLQIVCPSLFILIAYYFTGQPEEGFRLVMLWGICILTAIIAQLIGLVAGAAFSLQLGIFLVPASCIPMLIFSGFFIRTKELFPCLQPIPYISFFHYGFDGSMQAIYGYDRSNLTCSAPFCYYRTASKWLNFLDMEENRYWLDMFALGAYIVILQISLVLTLRWRLNKAK